MRKLADENPTLPRKEVEEKETQQTIENGTVIDWPVNTSSWLCM